MFVDPLITFGDKAQFTANGSPTRIVVGTSPPIVPQFLSLKYFGFVLLVLGRVYNSLNLDILVGHFVPRDLKWQHKGDLK